MVIFLSSAQSVYFNKHFCVMCTYQLFLIFDHTKSYVKKKHSKNQGHQCGAHRHQVTCKDQAGCPQA